MAWNRPNSEDDKYQQGLIVPGQNYNEQLYEEDLEKYIDFLEHRPTAGEIINCRQMNKFGKWVHLGEVLELFKEDAKKEREGK